jgi:hypothetical protein
MPPAMTIPATCVISTARSPTTWQPNILWVSRSIMLGSADRTELVVHRTERSLTWPTGVVCQSLIRPQFQDTVAGILAAALAHARASILTLIGGRHVKNRLQ